MHFKENSTKARSDELTQLLSNHHRITCSSGAKDSVVDGGLPLA